MRIRKSLKKNRLHKPRRRKRIPKQGKLPLSKVKRELQAVLRQRAIERDRSCVIGKYQDDLPPSWRKCGRLRKDGQIIVQAEHLVGRTKSISYADMDNILLVCQRHHFFFKRQHGLLYWSIVRKHVGEEIWSKIQAWEMAPNLTFSTEEWRNKLHVLLTPEAHT